MTAKVYLRKMQFYTDAVREMEARMTGVKAIDYAKDRVQTSPSDVLADNFARLEALRDRYYGELQKRILMIEQLPTPCYSQILFLRYIGGRSWPDIAVTLGYSVDTIVNRHGMALREFTRLYGDILKDVEKS